MQLLYICQYSYDCLISWTSFLWMLSFLLTHKFSLKTVTVLCWRHYDFLHLKVQFLYFTLHQSWGPLLFMCGVGAFYGRVFVHKHDPILWFPRVYVWWLAHFMVMFLYTNMIPSCGSLECMCGVGTFYSLY